MTPELAKQILDLMAVELARRGLGESYSDRVVMPVTLQMRDGRNIQLGRGTGTKVGTATDQKLGFFGKTPVVQQSTILSPTGGAVIDAESRTAISSVITVLRNFGFIA